MGKVLWDKVHKQDANQEIAAMHLMKKKCFTPAKGWVKKRNSGVGAGKAKRFNSGKLKYPISLEHENDIEDCINDIRRMKEEFKKIRF